MYKKTILLLLGLSIMASCESQYPVRIGRDDVKEYCISDFGKEPRVRIEFNRGVWRRSQCVMVQGSSNACAIELFLNGGIERKKFLAGFNVLEKHIDSVRIFFPGEMDFKGEVHDCARLEIYLKRYVKDLCSNNAIDRDEDRK